MLQRRSFRNGDAEEESIEPLGPTKAILSFVTKNPGTAPAKVVEKVEPIVRTRSPERRRLLFNTIYQLENRGRIVNRNGGLEISQ